MKEMGSHEEKGDGFFVGSVASERKNRRVDVGATGKREKGSRIVGIFILILVEFVNSKCFFLFFRWLRIRLRGFGV